MVSRAAIFGQQGDAQYCKQGRVLLKAKLRKVVLTLAFPKSFSTPPVQRFMTVGAQGNQIQIVIRALLAA